MIRYMGEVVGILASVIGAFYAYQHSNMLAAVWALVSGLWAVLVLQWHRKAMEWKPKQ